MTQPSFLLYSCGRGRIQGIFSEFFSNICLKLKPAMNKQKQSEAGNMFDPCLQPHACNMAGWVRRYQKHLGDSNTQVTSALTGTSCGHLHAGAAGSASWILSDGDFGSEGQKVSGGCPRVRHQQVGGRRMPACLSGGASQPVCTSAGGVRRKLKPEPGTSPLPAPKDSF